MLTQSVENVNKKVKFITKDIGRDRNEIISCPSMMTYSLETRMQDRHKQMLEAGIANLGNYKLSTIFICNDKRFRKLLDKIVNNL